MLKEAIGIILGVVIVFGGFLWLTLFVYFMMQGITPTLGRIAISAVVFTVVAIYYFKRNWDAFN